MARTITRSITQLSKAARSFAETGRSVAMTPRDDEVGLLASSFSEMVLQLKENETRLLRAERLAVWREMARRVAHEIKNPLTPIQLSVEGLRRNIPDGVDARFKARVEDATVTILEEVGRLRRYVDEFSRFARMPKPQLARCDVAEVLFTTARSYTAGVEKVQVTCDAEKREHVALADRQQLATAFSNVIQNALDAMKEGGSLSVSIRTLGKWIEVSIQDSGKGMPPDRVERVFEPYFTTKEAGTGLGMAIALKVVEDHGGRIAIESREGQGTLVRISLPCAGPEESLGGEVEVKGHGFHPGRG
jgi:nitrogen fixation/metabolism regulation signal transduction histidine kinase